MATTPNDLAFALDTELLGGYEPGEASLLLKADVLRVTDDGLRSILWGRYDEPHAELADLAVTGYLGTSWEHSYGWHANYRSPHSVELDQARAMVRVLARLQRRLTAIEQPGPTDRYNPPTSYPDFLFRVAKILKVRQFVAWGERRPNGTRPWTLLDTDGAAAWLDTQFADFRARYPVKATA